MRLYLYNQPTSGLQCKKKKVDLHIDSKYLISVNIRQVLLTHIELLGFMLIDMRKKITKKKKKK